MQLIRFTLFDHFDSLIVWIWLCPGLRFVSIINSVKICVDYCPVYAMDSVDSIMPLSVDCVVINNEIRWVDTHWVWFRLNTIETVYLYLHLIEWYQCYDYNESMMVRTIISVISVNYLTLNEQSLWKIFVDIVMHVSFW